MTVCRARPFFEHRHVSPIQPERQPGGHAGPHRDGGQNEPDGGLRGQHQEQLNRRGSQTFAQTVRANIDHGL